MSTHWEPCTLHILPQRGQLSNGQRYLFIITHIVITLFFVGWKWIWRIKISKKNIKIDIIWWSLAFLERLHNTAWAFRTLALVIWIMNYLFQTKRCICQWNSLIVRYSCLLIVDLLTNCAGMMFWSCWVYFSLHSGHDTVLHVLSPLSREILSCILHMLLHLMFCKFLSVKKSFLVLTTHTVTSWSLSFGQYLLTMVKNKKIVRDITIR